MADAKESGTGPVAPQPAPQPQQELMRVLGGNPLVAVVMAILGLGGGFSYTDLAKRLDLTSSKLGELSVTLTKMEAREAAAAEVIRAFRDQSARTDDRVRVLEANDVRHEFRHAATERAIEEMKKAVGGGR